MAYTSLSYLLPFPEDYFSNNSESEAHYALHHYRCNNQQLSMLSSKLNGTGHAFIKQLNLKPIKIGVISSSNSSLNIPAIIGTGIQHGYHIHVTEYSNTHPLLFLSDSMLDQFDKSYDFILLALNYEDISFWYETSKETNTLNPNIMDFLNQLEKVRSALAEKTGAHIVFQNIPRIPHSIFGNLDTILPRSAHYQLNMFNQALVAITQRTSSYLFDIASISENEGLYNWYDERMWYLGKLAFSPEYIPLYAEHFCRLISSVKGHGRRCIILDLDNTLWGGIIGQDGLEGINLGMGDPEGEAFIAFQKYLLHLKDRGVILAVCSKNNEADAIEVFKKHPHMLIKLEDIACFVANWKNKPTNILAIAKTLNLGLEALVFVDDNPLERENVRRYLGAVAVPEMPEDPALYMRALSQAGYFALSSFTQEDVLRSESYQNSLKVKEVLHEAIDIKDGLAALKMKLELRPFDAIGRIRIEQLINKSNQFNLTTRRYNADQIKAFEESDIHYTLQVSLQDKYGDYGMIGVLIGKIEGDVLTIDSWLMSCRVIGREIEKAVFQELIKYCQGKNISTIVGDYIKTDKNALVSDHYSTLGFHQDDAKKSLTEWVYQVQGRTNENLPFEIIRR